MQWVRMPTTFGWWFFTAEPQNYDLAMPLRVTQIMEPGGQRFEVGPYSQSKRITPDMGWWYGPVPLVKPQAAA